nr:hypothetical protein [Tanacetum cinerariifolium]
MHYAGRFTDSPNKQYVEGEICFVDMIDDGKFKIELVNTILSCLGYEDDDDLLLYYQIPLKSLDIGLKPLTESSSDEDGEGDSEFKDANDFVDEEHLVDEVEVNMSSFKFQIDREDDTEFIDPIQPHVNHKAFKAKARTHVYLRGDAKVQYSLLKDYANELQRCNPNITVKIDVYGEDDPRKTTRMFRRIYVCFGSLKRGFKERSRELLGLDGALREENILDKRLQL